MCPVYPGGVSGPQRSVHCSGAREAGSSRGWPETGATRLRHARSTLASRLRVRFILAGLERKTRLDPGAVAQATRHRELPGVQVDHRARDRHPEPGAVRLRGEEEIEGTRECFLGHARTGVL